MKASSNACLQMMDGLPVHDSAASGAQGIRTQAVVIVVALTDVALACQHPSLALGGLLASHGGAGGSRNGQIEWF
jgi:hypothetical protein